MVTRVLASIVLLAGLHLLVSAKRVMLGKHLLWMAVDARCVCCELHCCYQFKRCHMPLLGISCVHIDGRVAGVNRYVQLASSRTMIRVIACSALWVKPLLLVPALHV